LKPSDAPTTTGGIDLFDVRGGPLESECVTVRCDADDQLPFGFDLVEAAGRSLRPC